ncbi:MAG: hypothetical protein FWE59_07040, partial [Oscillospiraceae bacterium]|nr:hypothetical protein [Oscillospiraceae bacterium]
GLLYAVDETKGALAVYDTRDGTRIARIPLGDSYTRLARAAVDACNHLVYVTDEGRRATYVVDGVTRSLLCEVAAAGGFAAPMGVATLGAFPQ